MAVVCKMHAVTYIFWCTHMGECRYSLMLCDALFLACCYTTLGNSKYRFYARKHKQMAF